MKSVLDEFSSEYHHDPTGGRKGEGGSEKGGERERGREGGGREGGREEQKEKGEGGEGDRVEKTGRKKRKGGGRGEVDIGIE